MDAFSRGKTVDESLYTIRDRKVSIWFFFLVDWMYIFIMHAEEICMT